MVTAYNRWVFSPALLQHFSLIVSIFIKKLSNQVFLFSIFLLHIIHSITPLLTACFAPTWLPTKVLYQINPPGRGPSPLSPHLILYYHYSLLRTHLTSYLKSSAALGDLVHDQVNSRFFRKVFFLAWLPCSSLSGCNGDGDDDYGDGYDVLHCQAVMVESLFHSQRDFLLSSCRGNIPRWKSHNTKEKHTENLCKLFREISRAFTW